MFLVTSAEMQAMDRMAIDRFGIPGRVLMENAGREAARVFRSHFPATAGRTVGVLAGRGNNGGDGHVIARCLAGGGYPVTVFLLGTADRVQGDAAANLRLLPALGIPLIELPDEGAFDRHAPRMREADVWVDAVFGIGLRQAVGGLFRKAIEFVNGTGHPVLSVDMPSGLDADTGLPLGACVRARVTVTFGFPKIGLMVYPGAEFAGTVEVVDIGIPGPVADAVAPRQRLLTPDAVRRMLPARPADAHKGSTGHLLVVGGSPGKTGAAAMTATAALRVGAGLVTVATAAALNPVMETLVLEAMTAPLADGGTGRLGAAAREELAALGRGKSCLAVGPGLGMAPETGELVRGLVRSGAAPLVIDADGLNHLAGHLDTLDGRPAPVVLTPHPGEMARLMGMEVTDVQRDRVGCARRLATGRGVHVVLKGARTVVAHPDGGVFLNPTGNPGMASGGMGDVLTGAIAGLICQGVAPAEAARAGVYLHGAAADHLAAHVGLRGYLAGEVMRELPPTMARLAQGE
jgi:ADP-dependent NAD(P)H-hydrate dehydratase / NAD(P)H-hydrate epimerase